jgi:hypothetical protein
VSAADLARFATGCGDTVTVCLTPRWRLPGDHGAAGYTGFSDGKRELIVPVRDEFPRIARNLFRRRYELVVTVDARALAAAVRSAGRLCGRGEPVVLAFTAGAVTVRPVRDGEERGSQTVPAVLDIPPERLAFTPDRLAGVLAVIDGDARISVARPGMPVLVTPARDGDRFRAWVCTRADPVQEDRP